MDQIDSKQAKTIAKKAFPEYRGRKIRVVEAKSYRMADYWDGGSRCYVRAFEIASEKIADPKPATNVPWSGSANATFEIPEGVAIVEHQIFCGKDAGITIYLAPTRSLPEGARCVVLSTGGAS